MKRFNNLISIIILIAFIISTFPIISLASDYENHWAESFISELLRLNVISGDSEGNINPDNNITRAEYTKIINKLFSFEEKARDNFKDVLKEKWYYEDFQIAKAQGYIKGNELGDAEPERKLQEQRHVRLAILRLPRRQEQRRQQSRQSAEISFVCLET